MSERMCGICGSGEGDYPETEVRGWMDFSPQPSAPSPYDEPQPCHTVCVDGFVKDVVKQVKGVLVPRQLLDDLSSLIGELYEHEVVDELLENYADDTILLNQLRNAHTTSQGRPA